MNVSELFKGGVRVLVNADSEQEAILLSETSKKVYVIQNLPFLTGEAKLQEIISSKKNIEIILDTVVNSIEDTEVFSGINIQNNQTKDITNLKVDGMFVAIGLEPENKNFENVADLDNRGYITSNEDCLTKTKGIFTAGDCRTKNVRQVTTATADGATAAIEAIRYIDSL